MPDTSNSTSIKEGQAKTTNSMKRSMQGSTSRWEGRACSCGSGRSHLWLELDEATLFLERERRLLSESPRFTMPLPVMEKCLRR